MFRVEEQFHEALYARSVERNLESQKFSSYKGDWHRENNYINCMVTLQVSKFSFMIKSTREEDKKDLVRHQREELTNGNQA